MVNVNEWHVIIFFEHGIYIRSTVWGVIFAKMRSSVLPIITHHRSRPDAGANPPGNRKVGTNVEYQTVGFDLREGVRIVDDFEAQRAKIIPIKVGVNRILNKARK